MKERLLASILSFSVGIIFYVSGILSGVAFKSLSFNSRGFWLVVILTSIGGLAALVLGYILVVFIGGKMSLRITELICHLNKSKYIIEIVDNDPKTAENIIAQNAFLIAIPALVFAITATLAWDIFNLSDDEFIFQPILHLLDIFSKPVDIGPVLYSINTIPIIITLIVIAGFVPSMVLPYFRRFKITGINSAPFHTSYLFMVIKLVAGLGVLLTLTGFLYDIWWSDQGPRYYRYILPAMIGLSIHFSLGAFLGRAKAEDIIKKKLEELTSERIFQGYVNIQSIKREH